MPIFASLARTTVRSRALAHALTFPGAWEDHPWGESVVKVGKKIFVFLGSEEHHGVTVKLLASHAEALSFPGAAPTGYGLGKAGWVTIPFGENGPGTDLVGDWIDESYRRVATKTLVKQLDASA